MLTLIKNVLTISIMRITYLAHSGFMVETTEVIMIFDYFRDPSHSVVKTLQKRPDVPVLFFVSSHRPDHYKTEIFNLAQNHKRVYILSNDVEARDTNSDLAIQGMSAGDVVENLPGSITVKAYPSTGEGVSFLVSTRSGRTIFHAGDLNLWHWDEDPTRKEVAKQSDEFTRIVKRIAEECPAIDVAFVPVDVRQGKDFALGATEFMETIKVKNMFPMHFDGDARLACDFGAYPFHNNVSTTFHCMRDPGQSINLEIPKPGVGKYIS